MFRDARHAWFEDEAGEAVPNENVSLNKYNQSGSTGINVVEPFSNYLNPSIRPQRQPQPTPVEYRKLDGEYCLYVGSKTRAKIERARKGAAPGLPKIRVTLLFGVGGDLNVLGLRHYFEQIDDCILLNVPGVEPDSLGKGLPRWNVGVSGLVNADKQIKTNQIGEILAHAKLADVPYTISTLAAYSTGYGGLNQTVNEGLIPLDNIETVVYYDCVYRSDGPAPAKDDLPVQLSTNESHKGLDELNERSFGSAFNALRARDRIAKATNHKTKFVAYMATRGGSPQYVATRKYVIDFPTKIDFRAAALGSRLSYQECLYALFLTRCLSHAVREGQLRLVDVPRPFIHLAGRLPPRGQVASSLNTLVSKGGFTPSTTLLDWGKVNEANVKSAFASVPTAIKLTSPRGLLYPMGPIGPRTMPSSYPSPGNEAGALHMSILSEFGWEYLL